MLSPALGNHADLLRTPFQATSNNAGLLSDVGLRRDPSRRYTATTEVAPNPTYKSYTATVRSGGVFSGSA